MKTKTLSAIAAVVLLAALAYAGLVQAAPQGPGTVKIGTPERRTGGIDPTTGTTVQAQAGNVTSLVINSTKLTSRWQGYYGNITGTITLDDAVNNTLYNWQLATPQGEVYASNGSASGAVTWASVFCFNYTNNLSAGQSNVQRFNGSDLERMIGSSIGDQDSVNNTFNASFTGSFQVGSTTINSASGCREVTLFVNDAHQTARFTEVLLSDNDSIVFTSLIENSQTGFSGSPLDFEMIVGENGDTVAATNYYFFVELS